MIPDALGDYIREPSSILDHGTDCCVTARAWLLGLDATSSFARGAWHPPAWIRRRFDWGPMTWPVFWCGLPELGTLDCGGLAALATFLFAGRGERVAPVQLILRYPSRVTTGWRRRWERQGVPAGWISGEYCYHEGTAIIRGPRVSMWDASASRWLSPGEEGFGSVHAVRLWIGDVPPEEWIWEERPITTGAWTTC